MEQKCYRGKGKKGLLGKEKVGVEQKVRRGEKRQEKMALLRK